MFDGSDAVFEGQERLDISCVKGTCVLAVIAASPAVWRWFEEGLKIRIAGEASSGGWLRRKRRAECGPSSVMVPC